MTAQTGVIEKVVNFCIPILKAVTKSLLLGDCTWLGDCQYDYKTNPSIDLRPSGPKSPRSLRKTRARLGAWWAGEVQERNSNKSIYKRSSNKAIYKQREYTNTRRHCFLMGSEGKFKTNPGSRGGDARGPQSCRRREARGARGWDCINWDCKKRRGCGEAAFPRFTSQC